jgi:hypothetical protein
LHLRTGAIALLCISLISTLQGCLLTRVLETRTQLCDEQPTQVIVTRRPGSGLRVVFEKPTLTDRDVVWLVGHEPTETTGVNAVSMFSYEALPLDRPLDHASSLVVGLTFARLDGEYRLAEVEIPEKFNSILSPRLLDAAIRVVCKTQIGVVPPSTTFDLTSLDKTTLPSRDALTQLLGMRSATIARPNEMSYQYCLAPCAAKSSMVANLRFSFGDNGELNRANATYFRYSAVVDLTSSKPTATVELH